MTRNIRVEKVEDEKKEKLVAKTKNEFFEAVEGIGNSARDISSKDKMELLVPSEKIKALVDEVVKYKQEEKEAKANKETAEVDVIEWGKKQYDERGFSNNFQKSFRIKGVNEIVTFVTSDKFSKIKTDDLPTLKELLGKKFNEFFQKKTTILLQDSVFANPELQAELLERIGFENFGKFFKKEEEFTTIYGFDKKIFTLGRKVAEKVRDLVKQTSPSLK